MHADLDGVLGMAAHLPVIPAGWPCGRVVGAFMTTRAGGCSTGSGFDDGAGGGGLNLGLNTSDERGDVLRNRAVLRARVGLPVAWLEQVHGTSVVEIDAGLAARADHVHAVARADASVTRRDDVALAILTADCLPVLLTDSRGHVIGAAHAGWRGLAAGVLEATVGRMRESADPGVVLHAWIGAGIGPTAFEVGDEVRHEFVSKDDRAATAFRPAGIERKWIADLGRLAVQRLATAGVEHVWRTDACTYRSPGRYYSHRRQSPTGRMAAVIWRSRS